MPDQRPILSYRRPDGQHLAASEVFVLIAKWGAVSLIALSWLWMAMLGIFHIH